MHGNSIEIDDDNHLIISNRRSSEILKINRYSGEIIWRFGGPQNDFTILNDSIFESSKIFLMVLDAVSDVPEP